MASGIGGEAAFIGSLQELIELNRDAIEAFAAAAMRMSRPADRSRLATFLEDHERLLAELVALAHELGVDPADGAARPRLNSRSLSCGIVGDRVILEAMRRSEEDGCSVYERLMSRDDLSQRERAIVEQGLAIERRHRDWILEQLDARQGLLLLHL